MSHTLTRRRGAAAAAVCTAAIGIGLVAAPQGSTEPLLPFLPTLQVQGTAGSESAELLIGRQQFDAARTAPSVVVSPGAYTAAWQSAQSLPTAPGAWSEATNKPYNSDATDYRGWHSNSTAGSGLVSGRVVALAVDGTTLYAGAAAGGVFMKSATTPGAQWESITDSAPQVALSVGDLQVNPADHSLWLSTGEGNTGATSYVGNGVWRYAGGSWSRVGSTELDSHTSLKVAFDGVGNSYVATSRGLYKHSTSTSTLSTPWTLVLRPTTQLSPYDNIVNDVVVQPGTAGKVVLANAAWRGGGTAYNGFYISRNFGAAGSFVKVNPTGAINAKEIGNASFAYSADGKKLYAVVESTRLYNQAGFGVKSAGTVLAGVYASSTGVAGPWSLIADSSKLANSGSALKISVGGAGYQPGVQAWYNQFIGVDPNNANHVYLGLEEVYETTNGGSSWKTVGPYWNFYFSCWDIRATNPPGGCQPTTHSDQHAVAFGNGQVYVGNDGGVYSRKLAAATKWDNHNATLRSLQYYSVGVGTVAADSVKGNTAGVAVWGGLQDNGQSLQLPGTNEMVSPFGGDGTDTIVNPANGCEVVEAYVYLSMVKSRNCGYSKGGATQDTRDDDMVQITPPSTAGARFVGPFEADANDPKSWVTGGRYVYGNAGKGWDMTSADWVQLGDQGANPTTGVSRSSTAFASHTAGTAQTVYAAWCGDCNSGTYFDRGIGTNRQADGTLGAWRQLSMTGLPNRYISGVTVDPANAAHVYAVFNGYSRRWNEGPGAGVGHVYESTNGGTTWTLLDGDTAADGGALPDVPANDLVLRANGTIVVATDLGVFSKAVGQDWKRFGTHAGASAGLPNTVVLDLVEHSGVIYAATHGRGIWKN
jgi:hypothetical protein